MKSDEYQILVDERERLKKLLSSPSKHTDALAARLDAVRGLISNAHRETYSKNKNETKTK